MDLSLNFFSSLVGSTFVAETQAGPVELTLHEAKEYPRNGLPEAYRTPLSLIFTSQSEWILSQDNYYIDHPAFGRQVWTIVPVMPSSSSRPQMSAIPAQQPATPHYQVLFA